MRAPDQHRGRHRPRVAARSAIHSRGNLGHVPALDGLRAIAIVLVIASHLQIPWLAGGDDGVDVFFALSGFLITSLLLEERSRKGHLDFKRFYVHRFARLVPALVMMLVTLTIAFLITGTTQPGYFGAVLSAFLYLTPFTRLLMHWDPAFNHTWTLATEEYFYLAWPITLWWSIRRGWTWKHSAFALAALTVFIYGVYTASIILGDEISMFRVAAISAGCALAFVRRNSKPPSRPVLYGLGGVLLIAIASTIGRDPSNWPLSFPLAALGTLAAMWAVVDRTGGEDFVSHVLSLRPVVYVGAISYELYLWHYPIFIWFERSFEMSPNDSWWILLPVSVAAAAVSHAVAWRIQRHINERWTVRADRRAVSSSARIRTQPRDSEGTL